MRENIEVARTLEGKVRAMRKKVASTNFHSPAASRHFKSSEKVQLPARE
jgi:hypothetical protein